MLTQQEYDTIQSAVAQLGANSKMLKSKGEHIAARATLEMCGKLNAIAEKYKPAEKK